MQTINNNNGEYYWLDIDGPSVTVDGQGNIIECSEDNEVTCPTGVVVAGVCIEDTDNDGDVGDETQCFDALGKVISCDKDVDENCDPNIDANRCGGGGFEGDPNNPSNNPDSNNGDSFICDSIIGSFLGCAEAGAQLTPPSLEIPFGEGDLTNIAIVVGSAISVIIIIAIIAVIVRNR